MSDQVDNDTLRRISACSGLGGPGDLAWFWPAATFILAGYLWQRRKH